MGDRLKVVDKFADDETNSRSNTVLMLKVGGLRLGRPAASTAIT